MKKTMLLLVVALAFIMTPETQGAVAVFGTEVAYNAATGPQIFLIDFIGSAGYVGGDSFSSAVTFGSPEATDPTEVLHSGGAMSDAGSTTALNGVGPVDGVFTDPVYAFALEFSSAGEAETVYLYDESDVLIDAVTAPNAWGFFGVLSDTPIKKFVLENGEFSPGNRDRFFVDDFRANEPPIQAEKELTSIVPDGGEPIEIPDLPDLPEVPMHTRIYFTMVITVTNDSPGAIVGVVVKDNFGGDLELVSVDTNPVVKPDGKKVSTLTPISVGVGEVTVDWTGNSAKAHMTWDVGDLAFEDSASLTVVVATDINPGHGKPGKVNPKNEYTSPGIHYLNSGATVTGMIGELEVSHTSNSISVDVVE